MSEINNKILELIKRNYSANEITSVVGITNKQLFYRLNQIKNKGFNIDKKYYSNGEIEYFLKKDNQDKSNYKNSIITPKKDNELKTIVISDLHLSSIYENLDVLDRIYNYCLINDIHIIINAGDVNNCIGHLNNKKKYNSSNLKQIEHMLKVYPYDKNILNYILFGNHDYHMLVDDGIDIGNVLENKRHDLISLGFGIGNINIKNDSIMIRHPLDYEKYNSIDDTIIIEGHHHKSKLVEQITNKSIIINVPTLSDLILDQTNTLKNQALEVTFMFNNGIIRAINMRQLYISNIVYTINEIYLNQLDNARKVNNSVNLNGEYQYKLKNKRTVIK